MQLKNVQNDSYVNAIYKFIFSIEIYIKLLKKQGGQFTPHFNYLTENNTLTGKLFSVYRTEMREQKINYFFLNCLDCFNV